MVNAPGITLASTEPPADSSPMSATASPIKALQSIVHHKISGRLTIRQATEEPIFWHLHTGQGQLHYASSVVGEKERTSYLLQRMNSPLLDWRPLYSFDSTYTALYQAWQEGVISLQHLRDVLRNFCQDALIHIATQPKVLLQFERTVGLDPILLSMSLPELGSGVVSSIKQWQRLRPQILSPFQRLSIHTLPQKETIAHALEALQGTRSPQSIFAVLEQSPCFYELAFQLDMDVLHVATALCPLIQSGVIVLHPFNAIANTEPMTIACIDDSSTVQRKVKLILESEGYRVVSLTEPLRALSSLVREKPKLVLLDITMPDLDGYDLCRMLRQSSALRDLPIVMLTGRDGLIDRVRAKIVGASDYMTKPFDAQTLMAVVRKHIPVEVRHS